MQETTEQRRRRLQEQRERYAMRSSCQTIDEREKNSHKILQETATDTEVEAHSCKMNNISQFCYSDV
jgi:hypothetical protein